jgi:hypothetical protein
VPIIDCGHPQGIAPTKVISCIAYVNSATPTIKSTTYDRVGFSSHHQSIRTLCYDSKGDLQQNNVTERQIYHRKQSRKPEDVAIAKKQIASQELWGGPPRNYLGSDIPKVKGYMHQLELLNDRQTKESGIEFTTMVAVDSYHPKFAYWSGDRVGVRNEDGYAKIKVTITYCNQLEKVYIADEQSNAES